VEAKKYQSAEANSWAVSGAISPNKGWSGGSSIQRTTCKNPWRVQEASRHDFSRAASSVKNVGL
jgi:hypothetical protein